MSFHIVLKGCSSSSVVPSKGDTELLEVAVTGAVSGPGGDLTIAISQAKCLHVYICCVTLTGLYIYCIVFNFKMHTCM